MSSTIADRSADLPQTLVAELRGAGYVAWMELLQTLYSNTLIICSELRAAGDEYPVLHATVTGMDPAALDHDALARVRAAALRRAQRLGSAVLLSTRQAAEAFALMEPDHHPFDVMGVLCELVDSYTLLSAAGDPRWDLRDLAGLLVEPSRVTDLSDAERSWLQVNSTPDASAWLAVRTATALEQLASWAASAPA